MTPEPTPKHSDKVAALLAVLPSAKNKKILILPHDNPDPDSLASAAALCALIKHRIRKSPVIGLGGIIGRSENRALVATLGMPLVPVEQFFPDFTGAVILVDTQPHRANNSLPDHITPAAVIDHHPDWGESASVPFVDLRESRGATSTIVTEYLAEGEVPVETRIATALFYGISSETQYLGREAAPADIIACQFLYPYVDKRLLGEIQYPLLHRDYFHLIGQAVHNTMLYDDIAVTILEEVPYPDAVAEMADLLLRLDELQWAACFAFYRDFLYVSLRTQDPHATAGLLLASLLPSGMAGGHGMVAGGKVKTSRRSWRKAARQIGKALLQAWGKTSIRPQPLVRRGANKRDDEEIHSILLSLHE